MSVSVSVSVSVLHQECTRALVSMAVVFSNASALVSEAVRTLAATTDGRSYTDGGVSRLACKRPPGIQRLHHTYADVNEKTNT